MSDEMNLGAEVQEVAEPAGTGAEVQEFAEPVVEAETEPVIEEFEEPGDKSDSAFAEYRRRAEEAERELADLRAERLARQETMKRITGSEDGEFSAIAEAMGIDEADLIATFEAESDAARKDLRIQDLENQLNEVTAEKMMQQDLAEIQRIDPDIKDLSELGETFLKLKEKGVDTESAYWAAKAKREATQMKPPKAPGRANISQPEKNFFTEEEVNAMTSEQKYANADKILASLPRWKK